MPRTTRSTVSSDTGSTSGDVHASTTCLNPPPSGGHPEAGYESPGVSTEGGSDPQGAKRLVPGLGQNPKYYENNPFFFFYYFWPLGHKKQFRYGGNKYFNFGNGRAKISSRIECGNYPLKTKILSAKKIRESIR